MVPARVQIMKACSICSISTAILKNGAERNPMRIKNICKICSICSIFSIIYDILHVMGYRAMLYDFLKF